MPSETHVLCHLTSRQPAACWAHFNVSFQKELGDEQYKFHPIYRTVHDIFLKYHMNMIERMKPIDLSLPLQMINDLEKTRQHPHKYLMESQEALVWMQREQNEMNPIKRFFKALFY